jgi:ribokinase
VLGRPRAHASSSAASPGGLAARLAAACAGAGARVELVGSVGDDAAADRVVVSLSQRGVGHAALLRVPGTDTPREASRDPLPRFEAADIELALRYLPDCRVLILAEPLHGDALAAALEAAEFHGASVIAVVPAGTEPDPELAEAATVLATPTEDPAGAFAELVARYATGLDAGVPASDAFSAARQAVGWEPAV